MRTILDNLFTISGSKFFFIHDKKVYHAINKRLNHLRKKCYPTTCSLCTHNAQWRTFDLTTEVNRKKYCTMVNAPRFVTNDGLVSNVMCRLYVCWVKRKTFHFSVTAWRVSKDSGHSRLRIFGFGCNRARLRSAVGEACPVGLLVT